MENKSHALAAGLFVLVVAAMLAGLAMWLTRDSAKYQLYELSTKDGISGLQPEASVRYKGVGVGKVTRIDFDPQVSGNVLIRIAVDDHAPIGPNTFAQLGYQGVTGLAHVLLDDGDHAVAVLPPGPSGLPRLPLKPSPFGRIAAQAPNLLSQIEEGSQRINTLLGDDNQRQFSEALRNMSAAAASVSALAQRLDATVTQRLDPALASLQPLAGDARKTLQSVQQASAGVAMLTQELDRSAKRLAAEGGPLDQITEGTQALVRAADQLGTTTLPRINRAMDATAGAAGQVRRAANSVSDNPQLFLYGAGQTAPGPGEPGFQQPAP